MTRLESEVFTDQKITKPKKHEMFSELQQAGRLLSQGFMKFLVVYRPRTMMKLTESLQSFATIQDQQAKYFKEEADSEASILYQKMTRIANIPVELNDLCFIQMPKLTESLLNEYTLFLSKYGRYFVLELLQFKKINKLFGAIPTIVEHEDDAIEYNVRPLSNYDSTQSSVAMDVDQDQLQACLEGADFDLAGGEMPSTNEKVSPT